MGNRTNVLKITCHSRRVLEIATKHGWVPGARYTNLRDVKNFEKLYFLDIDWKNYDFQKHLSAARATNPHMTVARDVEDRGQLGAILDQAHELNQYCKYVIVVPKDPKLSDHMHKIPKQFVLGFSVPTKYGGTGIDPALFNRPVHLLGGRPDVQRALANTMPVISLDCNRFTLDAAFGDYFDGTRFRPHPTGGYERCIEDSVTHINGLWNSYTLPETETLI